MWGTILPLWSCWTLVVCSDLPFDERWSCHQLANVSLSCCLFPSSHPLVSLCLHVSLRFPAPFLCVYVSFRSRLLSSLFLSRFLWAVGDVSVLMLCCVSMCCVWCCSVWRAVPWSRAAALVAADRARIYLSENHDAGRIWMFINVGMRWSCASVSFFFFSFVFVCRIVIAELVVEFSSGTQKSAKCKHVPAAELVCVGTCVGPGMVKQSVVLSPAQMGHCHMVVVDFVLLDDVPQFTKHFDLPRH